MQTIPAQVLYDLRDKESAISGTDLHDLFRMVVPDGNPSPSGQTPIRVDALVAIAERVPYYREFVEHCTAAPEEKR